MKFKVKNLGPIKQAEFSLADLTTISGMNNTGKTYVTHAVFGFLDYFEHQFQPHVSNENFATLLQDGKLTINLRDVHERRNEIAAEAATQYSKEIADIFGSSETLFADTELFVSELPENDQLFTIEFERTVGTKQHAVIQARKEADSFDLVASLLMEDTGSRNSPVDFSRHFIADAIKRIVFKSIIPSPFISSAERTGAAIFQKELDFTRSRLIEILGDKTTAISPFDLLNPFKGEYPVAVRKNVDFIRDLPSVSKRNGYLLEHHPEILSAFSDLIGGTYKVEKDGDIKYVPQKTKGIKLGLVESSSSVRSLLDLGFYLRHMAAPGDLLVIDEPELNLHPSNQRRVARLIAKLVNVGIRVFVTTHSDYIIKEFNTLIMLSQDIPRLKVLAAEEGYATDELLDVRRIRSYVACTQPVKLDGNKIKTRCPTLVAAKITQATGIEITSFDESIEEMNRIQDAIVWGGDE